jgi:hypothetical protein
MFFDELCCFYAAAMLLVLLCIVGLVQQDATIQEICCGTNIGRGGEELLR